MKKLGVPFRVCPSDAPERLNLAEGLDKAIMGLAYEKAKAVYETLPPEDIAIGSDTLVILDGQILGKPADETEAASMLRRLSGRMHEVKTAVCLVGRNLDRREISTTKVWFRPLAEAEILAYVRSGEPMDKAGAYGIQDKGALLVRRIDGDYFGVMGLPVCLLHTMLCEEAKNS